MIRLILLLVVVAIVAGAIWWERTEKSKKRQIFFSLYNKALAKATDKKKLSGISINILDVMDETDIGPTYLHTLLKEMERTKRGTSDARWKCSRAKSIETITTARIGDISFIIAGKRTPLKKIS